MRDKELMFTAPSDPRWNWYDDLASPDEYLRETMAARKIILSRYGLPVLASEEAAGNLRNMRLWMGYLHHRWAIDAAMKYIGGQYQNIVLKGDTLKPVEPVPAALQRTLLKQLMEAIQPAGLAIPDDLLGNLPASSSRDQEDMADDYVFDHLRAARILAGSVLEPLLAADRAARVIALIRSRDRRADAAGNPAGRRRRNLGRAPRCHAARAIAAACRPAGCARRIDDARRASTGDARSAGGRHVRARPTAEVAGAADRRRRHGRSPPASGRARHRTVS